MGRPTDRFRDHVTILEEGPNKGQFKCKYCPHIFSHGSGSSRFKSHLSGIEGRGVKICPNVPDDVRHDAVLEIESPCKRAKTSTEKSDHYGDQTVLASQSNPSQGFNPTMSPKIRDKSAVDAKLAKYLIANNIRFDVVNSHSFVDFVKSATEYGPTYELPDSSTLEGKCVSDLRLEVEEYVNHVKKSWGSTGCTIMLDVICNFINVIAYSRGGAIFLDAYKVSKHEVTEIDAENILCSIMKRVSVDPVVQVVTNDAVMFDGVRDLIAKKYPSIYVIRCVAQEIHSLLKNIYDQVDWVHTVIDNARAIVEYMVGDANVLSLMRKYTQNKILKQPCLTKFASNYQMLQSIYDNKIELQKFVASTEWQELPCNNEDKRMETSKLIESESFWNQGGQVVMALEPIIQVLCLVEDNQCTSGYLYEAMEKAEKAIYGHCSRDQTMYSKLLELFVEMRRNCCNNDIHAAAAFLNPAYRFNENFKENLEMTAGLEFICENVVDNEERANFSDDVQRYRMNISTTFSDTAHKMMGTNHPSVWWEKFGHRLPVLKKYAMRILSQPCKSSCNLKYSAYEITRGKNMWGIAPKSLDNPVYIKMSTEVMEKYRLMEVQCLKPIDLKNCIELPDYPDPKSVWHNHHKESTTENSGNKMENGTDNYCSIDIHHFTKEAPLVVLEAEKNKQFSSTLSKKTQEEQEQRLRLLLRLRLQQQLFSLMQEQHQQQLLQQQLFSQIQEQQLQQQLFSQIQEQQQQQQDQELQQLQHHDVTE